jgi:hypothetical protein
MKKIRMFLLMAFFAASVVAAFAFKANDEWYLIENGNVELYTGQTGTCEPSDAACFYQLKDGATEGSANPIDYEPVPGHEGFMFVRD